jgi:hypothetical protein
MVLTEANVESQNNKSELLEKDVQGAGVENEGNGTDLSNATFESLDPATARRVDIHERRLDRLGAIGISRSSIDDLVARMQSHIQTQSDLTTLPSSANASEEASSALERATAELLEKAAANAISAVGAASNDTLGDNYSAVTKPKQKEKQKNKGKGKKKSDEEIQDELELDYRAGKKKEANTLLARMGLVPVQAVGFVFLTGMFSCWGIKCYKEAYGFTW